MLGGIETALTEIAEALSADNSAGMAGVARAIAGLKLAIPAAQMTLPPMQVTLPPMQVLLPQQTPPAIHVEAVKQWSKISVTAKKESRTGLVTSYLIERIS